MRRRRRGGGSTPPPSGCGRCCGCTGRGPGHDESSRRRPARCSGRRRGSSSEREQRRGSADHATSAKPAAARRSGIVVVRAATERRPRLRASRSAWASRAPPRPRRRSAGSTVERPQQAEAPCTSRATTADEPTEPRDAPAAQPGRVPALASGQAGRPEQSGRAAACASSSATTTGLMPVSNAPYVAPGSARPAGVDGHVDEAGEPRLADQGGGVVGAIDAGAPAGAVGRRVRGAAAEGVADPQPPAGSQDPQRPPPRRAARRRRG
jgi:hypothetical protein